MWNYPNPLLQIPRDRFQVREHVRKLPMDEDPQATTWRWCHNWLVGCWDENGLSLSHNILTLTLYSVQDHISYISSKQPYHPNNHVHDYYMRSYHNISDCWNTVVGMQSCIMWDMLQDPVNHVIHHPLVIAEFPPSTAFTQCLAPSWFAWKLQVFGLHSNAQITAQTEVEEGDLLARWECQKKMCEQVILMLWNGINRSGQNKGVWI